MGAASGEVSGRTVTVTVEGVMSVFQRRVRQMLDDQGITDPDPRPEGWYDMGNFLTVLETVEDDAGENALEKIGQATPNHVEWPTDPDDPAAALAALDDVYAEQHRDAEGGFAVEETDDGVRVRATTPYPCAFDRGLVKGTAEAFGAGYARVCEPEACRADGDDACVYDVSW